MMWDADACYGHPNLGQAIEAGALSRLQWLPFFDKLLREPRFAQAGASCLTNGSEMTGPSKIMSGVVWGLHDSYFGSSNSFRLASSNSSRLLNSVFSSSLPYVLKKRVPNQAILPEASFRVSLLKYSTASSGRS